VEEKLEDKLRWMEVAENDLRGLKVNRRKKASNNGYVAQLSKY
jgi:hypothetical protein